MVEAKGKGRNRGGTRSTQSKEQELLGRVTALCGKANQIFRPTSYADHGIDGEIEFRSYDGRASGRRVYLQLKNGDSYLSFRQMDSKWIFAIEERHAEYWVSQPADVYLVIEAPEKLGNQPLWMNITQYLRAQPDPRNRRIVFDGEILDQRAIERCRDRHLNRSVSGATGVRLVGLPPLGGQFFGRAAELATLVRRLKERQNTAVAGFAGFGKTTLALAAIKQILEDGETATKLFPDGIVFLDLYRLRGQRDSLWHALADALENFRFLKDSPPRERAREACRDRRLLLVMEGGEEADGQDGRPTFSELVQPLSSESRWLLLTRLNYQTLPANRIWLQDTLALEEAGHLLDSLTGRERIPSDLREELLRLLDGHPLAISWAGNLLALGNESPRRLATDFKKQPLLSLQDPLQKEHTLSWLFHRSVRRLAEPSRLLKKGP